MDIQRHTVSHGWDALTSMGKQIIVGSILLFIIICIVLSLLLY